MENALSSPAVQEWLVRSSRTFPSPSASVVLPIPAGARTSDGAFSRAFPEPEAEGAPPLRAADPSEISSSGRRGVKRSTIYSGSSKRSDVAMKKTDEGRHHSKLRRPTMGKPSGFVSGSSSRSSRPPRPGSTARRSGLTAFHPIGRGRCPLRSGQRRLVTPSAPQQGRHHPQHPAGHRDDGPLGPPPTGQAVKDRPPALGMQHQPPGSLRQRPTQQRRTFLGDPRLLSTPRRFALAGGQPGIGRHPTPLTR